MILAFPETKYNGFTTDVAVFRDKQDISIGCDHRRAAAHAAVVGDHAVAGDEAEAGVGDARAERIPGELADRFDQAEEAAGGAGLAARELAAAGVERAGAVGREGVPAHELRRLAFAAQA